jgi:hypothetical protein
MRVSAWQDAELTSHSKPAWGRLRSTGMPMLLRDMGMALPETCLINERLHATG